MTFTSFDNTACASATALAKAYGSALLNRRLVSFERMPALLRLLALLAIWNLVQSVYGDFHVHSIDLIGRDLPTYYPVSSCFLLRQRIGRTDHMINRFTVTSSSLWIY